MRKAIVVVASLATVSDLCGEAAGWEKISNAAQPECRLTLEGGKYKWEVGEWIGIKAETRTVDTPWREGERAISAVWKRDGETVRREFYPLPRDKEEFARKLRDRNLRIAIPVKMKEKGKLTVAIDGADGRRVRNLVKGIEYGAGEHEVAWDGYCEDGTPAAPGAYEARVVTHPGLGKKFLGYCMCGGDQEQWIPWGPNHLPLKTVQAKGGKVALQTFFTEGGHSTVVLDESGKFLHGVGEGWGNGDDALHAVNGEGEYFYGVRCKAKERELAIKGYSWERAARIPVAVKGAPPTIVAGAAIAGGALYVSNEAGGTLDRYEFKEEGGRATATFLDSRKVERTGPVKAWKGEIYFAPEEGVYDMDRDGRRIYALKRGDSRVRVYDAASGRLERTIGEDGGFYLGKWRKNRLVNPNGLGLDGSGHLWVTENRRNPKRVTKWDVERGECIYEKFGSPEYGSPGAGMDGEEPTRWMAYDTLWELDAEKGIDRPVAVVARGDGRRRPLEGIGNAEAPAGATETDPVPDTFLHYRWFSHGGKKWVWGLGRTSVLFGFEGEGLKPVMMFSNLHIYLHGAARRALKEGTNAVPELAKAYAAKTPAAAGGKLMNAMRNDRSLMVWRDLDGDGKVSAGEIELEPDIDPACGYWGYWPDGAEFTVAVRRRSSNKNLALRFGPEGGEISAAGYSYAKALETARELKGRMPWDMPLIRDSEGMSDRFGRAICMTQDPYMLGIGGDGSVEWTMYSPYPRVHGSQRAPLPEPGELQGVLFPLGAVPFGEKADVFAAMNNHGRVFFATTDGIYLDELFSDCRVSARNDENLIGGEAFGGWFGRDEAKGKAILLAGGYRRHEITGLDKVKETRVRFEVSAEQAKAAAEKPFARAGEAKKEVKPVEVPEAEDGLWRNFGHRGGALIGWRGGLGDVRVRLARTEGHLLAAWTVSGDGSPWVNNGTDEYLMFKTGDCADFQYLDEGGEPCRLMISPKAGKPGEVQTVTYRHNGKGTAMGFSSPWRTHTVGDVKILDDVETTVRADTAGRTWTVTAKIPLKHVGRRREMRADFGVVLGDEKGQINLARSYWANKETGLVNDVPGEIMPEPKKWGTVKFAEKAGGKEKGEAETAGGMRLRKAGPLQNPYGIIHGECGRYAPGVAWDERRKLLFAGAGRGMVHGITPDGRQRVRYRLPKAPEWARFDRLELTPGGDLVALAGGDFGHQHDLKPRGRLYRIRRDAPDGSEAELLAENVKAIGPCGKDGRMPLVRWERSTRKNPRESVVETLNPETGERKELLRAPDDRYARYPSLWDWNPAGNLCAVIEHKKYIEFKDGREPGKPFVLFGARDLGMENGRFEGDELWSYGGDTIKLLDGKTLQPTPGVVLGGASGAFLGVVERNFELDVRGMAKMGGDLYAAASVHNGAIWLLELDRKKGKMNKVRRLGGIVKRPQLGIDGEGRVWCDGLFWDFGGDFYATPYGGVRRSFRIASGMLPNGTVVDVSLDHRGWHGVSGGNAEKMKYHGAFDKKAVDWKKEPYRVEACEAGKGFWELRALAEDGTGIAWKVKADGSPAGDAPWRKFEGAAPAAGRFEARDGELTVRTDAGKGTLELWREKAGEKPVKLDEAAGLAGPETVAIRGRRVVVWEAGKQRVMRYMIETGTAGSVKKERKSK